MHLKWLNNMPKINHSMAWLHICWNNVNHVFLFWKMIKNFVCWSLIAAILSCESFFNEIPFAQFLFFLKHIIYLSVYFFLLDYYILQRSFFLVWKMVPTITFTQSHTPTIHRVSVHFFYLEMKGFWVEIRLIIGCKYRSDADFLSIPIVNTDQSLSGSALYTF